jgi:transposase
MAALSAIRSGPYREIYLKLRTRGTKAKAALGAIMRRILLLMRAILKSGVAFDPSRVGKSPIQAD